MDTNIIIVVTFFIFILIMSLTIFVDWFGILRFNKIKNSEGFSDFINNYKNKKKNTKDKVVVSFTTTPERVKNIQPMLNSLLDQSVRVDQIAMNIPDECNGQKYNVPIEYKNICNIYKAGKDYGSGTKYIPTLLRENECGTKIILLDDDNIYGYDLFEKLIQESEKNPDKCIYAGDKFSGSGGILIKPEFMRYTNHDQCDDKWLEDNIKAEKVHINYNKNRKYI